MAMTRMYIGLFVAVLIMQGCGIAGQHLIITYVMGNDPSGVRYALEEDGCTPNATETVAVGAEGHEVTFGTSPVLLIAAERGFTRVVSVLLNTTGKGFWGLLEYKIDLETVSDALILVAKRSYRPFLWIEYGKRIPVRPENYIAIVKLLLEAGADPNHRDDEGATALMHAAFGVGIGIAGKGRARWTFQEVPAEITHLLIKAGAKKDINDESGRNASSWLQRGKQSYKDFEKKWAGIQSGNRDPYAARFGESVAAAGALVFAASMLGDGILSTEGGKKVKSTRVTESGSSREESDKKDQKNADSYSIGKTEDDGAGKAAQVECSNGKTYRIYNYPKNKYWTIGRGSTLPSSEYKKKEDAASAACQCE